MSEALEFAAKWKTIQGSGDEQIAAAKRAEGGAPAPAPAPAPASAGAKAAKDTTAEVAAAARAAVAARSGAAPGAAPAAPVKRPMREIERESKELTIDAKKQQIRMAGLETIAKQLKLSMDAIAPAMLELTEKQQAAYDALPDAAKRKFVSDLVAFYLKRQGL